MSKTELVSVVFFRFGDLERPIAIVERKTDRLGLEQVTVRLRSSAETHLTLHQKPDGAVLSTFQSADKPPGVWDEHVRHAAESQGWDGDKHVRYYVQQQLRPFENEHGRALVGQRIWLGRATAPAKYERAPSVRLQAPGVEFILTLRLSTVESPCVCSDESAHVRTALGDLCFADAKLSGTWGISSAPADKAAT